MAIRIFVLLCALVVLVMALETGKTSFLEGKHKKYLLKVKHQEAMQKRDECDPSEYRCSDGRCISAHRVCDTHVDCWSRDDEFNCSTGCSGPNQVKCLSDGHCIGIRDKCDGYADCLDRSDEENCATHLCPPGNFHCATSNECINDAYVCDYDRDCTDGSDEKNCVNATCNSHQFKCGDGSRCIPVWDKCDGTNNCPDHSDEVGCTCPSSHFQCANGPCIPKIYVCDHDNDCGDQSDEQNCPNTPTGRCTDMLTYEDCLHLNKTSRPICLTPEENLKFCHKFCGLCT